MSKDKKINLENYDYNNKGLHLNSPFSKKALEFLGIEEKELLTLNLEEYINLNKDCKELPSELQKERYQMMKLLLIKKQKIKFIIVNYTKILVLIIFIV